MSVESLDLKATNRCVALASSTDDALLPTSPRGIAVEARLAVRLTEEIHELDERITLMTQPDPAGIITFAPGLAR